MDPQQNPQQPVLQYVNPYVHMNAQIVQNGAICVRNGIEYQIYFDEDGTLSFHQVEFHTSTSIDGEEAEQLRQSVEEAERRAEEAEQQVQTLKQQLEESQRETHDARQEVERLTKFIQEGEEKKKTTEAPTTEAPTSSWSETVSSTPEKDEEKEEKKEEKKTPKIVVQEHVVLKTDNKYSTDFVGILREILPQLQEWLVDLNDSEDTEMYKYINLDEEYMWLAKILGVTKTNFDVSINGNLYEIYSYNKKKGLYRVMTPFLNAVLKKIGGECTVSVRGSNFRYLKLKITNQEKFEQNLSSLGDYLDDSDANILALIEDNCRN
jgi:flagellar biosynthesis GTPase FlhF